MNASLNDILLWRRGQVHSQAVDDIVLVAIDDTTAAQYGPLPLRRSVLAKGISRLASLGPRALALDLLLGESGPTGDDAALGDALRLLPGAVLAAALGRVHVYPDSRVIFNQQSQGFADFTHLFFGSIKVHIEKLGGRPNPHNMTTPTAVIAVRGTTFSVFVDDTDATLVAVDEGMVAVANRISPSNELLLRPGQRTWVRGNQPPLRAQAFRGRSDQADMMPGMGAMKGMAGSASGMSMGGAMNTQSGSALSGHMPGTGGMSGGPGPHH